MDLVFKKEHAMLLESRYTVLELETIRVKDQEEPLTAWCVVAAEKIIPELDMLPINQAMHADLIRAIAHDDTEKSIKLCADLKGKFGGELDSFYEEIEKRIQNTGSTLLYLTE